MDRRETTMDFAFHDTIAGYVVYHDVHEQWIDLKTGDGRAFRVRVTQATAVEVLRNLGEPYHDANGVLVEQLDPDRYLFARGIFYPEDGSMSFEATSIVLLGEHANDLRTDETDWWTRQIRSLADFYLGAQFPDGEIDYGAYRTRVSLDGRKLAGTRQEADTISRLVYGFATAYLLTGEERYLVAAERGTAYQRTHFRCVGERDDLVYWRHAVDVHDSGLRVVLQSECREDACTIPAYEQIYALTGAVQTYRITGDPGIRSDVLHTVNFLERYFRDPVHGGYFSHVDAETLNPRSATLGINRARKNWNSVGDHAPAYLVNFWLATGDPRLADLLIDVADTVERHFPDSESPFVHERFHSDWTPDTTWGWQQDRGVVGHNLKIAWTLARVHNMRPDPRFEALARRIADTMPTVGLDLQRGGWFDVMERGRKEGEPFHRHVWHDRKAWWQQEQAILAYLILGGTFGKDQYLKLARDSAAFYCAWFPDHDDGGIYFSVLANGLPYLLGDERLKGSHDMAGYHSFELCYLAAVYTNLLVLGRPLDLHFKPRPGAYGDGVLRALPDLLPKGRVRLAAVWVDDAPWTAFDADAATVRLPDRDSMPPDGVRVRVRFAPAC
jgi:mannose/cellobiose epimerase-like protein (N-acyl-D-glucosamine 2-epimerase family)